MKAEMRMSRFSRNPYGLSLADSFLSLSCFTEVGSHYRPIKKQPLFLGLKINSDAYSMLYFFYFLKIRR